MAGLLTYSLAGAFPFYPPKPWRRRILFSFGTPDVALAKAGNSGKSAFKFLEITAAGTVAEFLLY